MARHTQRRLMAAAAIGCLALLALPALAQGARLLYTSANAVAADDAGLVRANSTQRRALAGDGPQQSLAQNMQDLMNAFCRYQSGSDCGEIDWTGNTDWYRRYFITLQPSSITTGIGAPNVPLSNQVLQNKTVSNFYCPYRDFAYVCQLDKQAFQQTVHTTSHSSGWNVGTTVKVSASFGVEFLGTGGSAGPVAQFSFSYSFQDATANAHTDQTTTVESVSVKMDPAQKQCLLLTTRLSVVKATGTQDAYVAVKNWVGTHQDPARHWKWDSQPGETHYYRAMTFPTVVQLAKQAGLPEASQWTVVGDEARIVMPFDLDIDFGTSGYNINSYAPAGSDECKRWDPSLKAAVNSAAAVHNGPVGGLDGALPIIKALPV